MFKLIDPFLYHNIFYRLVKVQEFMYVVFVKLSNHLTWLGTIVDTEKEILNESSSIKV